MKLIFIFLLTTFLNFPAFAKTDFPKPDQQISVRIDGKAVAFLGIIGSDGKSIVPIYSENCETEKCQAVIAAKSANADTVKKSDRQGGNEPSYILCEKLEGVLVEGQYRSAGMPSLFCKFEKSGEVSYIDPFVIWAYALSKLPK